MAVLAIHIPHYAHGGFRENPWFFLAFAMDYGYLGVHLFVLLSGFCIHRRAAISAAQGKGWQLNWLEFWKRRFWRLYPPYLGAIILSLIAAGYFHKKFSLLSNPIGLDLVAHLLMLHNLTVDFGTSLGNGALWSLGMEEQLYAGYFLLLILISRCFYFKAVLFVGIVTLFWRIGYPLFPTASIGVATLGKWYLWPFMFWIHWVLGAIAVDSLVGNINLPRWCGSIFWSSFFAGIGILLNKNLVQLLQKTQVRELIDALWFQSILPTLTNCGELAWAISFFCLLNWCVSKENSFLIINPVSKGIATLGGMSYSVYLTHIPVLHTINEHISFGNSSSWWLLRCLTCFLISLCVGIVFYWSIERWFLVGRFPRFKCKPSIETTTPVGG